MPQAMKSYKTINVILIFLMATGIALGQDWPQFRGPSRDSKVTGFKAPAAWPAELTQLWKVTVGTGDATPVLAGKNVYLNTRQGDSEVVLCLDAATGKEKWKTTYPASAVTGPAASHPGPRSTPAFADNKLVTIGATGIVNCLNAEDGKVLWKKEDPSAAVPQFFVGMSPLIADGICIVHLGTKDKGEILAIDLKTGAEKWKWSGDGPAYSSPSIMTIGNQKLLIIITEKNLMALNFADGKLQWQIAAPPLQRFYNCTSPYINGQNIYYTGQGAGTKAIEVVKNGNQFTTRELWTNAEAGAKWNTPVLKDGYLYGFTDTRKAYCISAVDGKTAWIDTNTTSDFATYVDCGSVLIGLPSTGNLLVYKADPKAYSEVARYKVAETPVYSFPVVAGNIIYIKDAENLTAFTIK